jgi:hypothetical protein
MEENMPRTKKLEKRGFLLLEKKKKTYNEFLDKKALVKKLMEIAKSGKSPSDFIVVPHKSLPFDIEYTVSIKERAQRKIKRTRKPRKPRTKVVTKRRTKAIKKPVTKAVPKAKEMPAENTK